RGHRRRVVAAQSDLHVSRARRAVSVASPVFLRVHSLHRACGIIPPTKAEHTTKARSMPPTGSSVKATLRIPGAWSQPRDLLDRLPAGFRLTADTLVLPDDAEFELT